MRRVARRFAPAPGAPDAACDAENLGNGRFRARCSPVRGRPRGCPRPKTCSGNAVLRAFCFCYGVAMLGAGAAPNVPRASGAAISANGRDPRHSAGSGDGAPVAVCAVCNGAPQAAALITRSGCCLFGREGVRGPANAVLRESGIPIVKTFGHPPRRLRAWRDASGRYKGPAAVAAYLHTFGAAAPAAPASCADWEELGSNTRTVTSTVSVLPCGSETVSRMSWLPTSEACGIHV